LSLCRRRLKILRQPRRYSRARAFSAWLDEVRKSSSAKPVRPSLRPCSHASGGAGHDFGLASPTNAPCRKRGCRWQSDPGGCAARFTHHMLPPARMVGARWPRGSWEGRTRPAIFLLRQEGEIHRGKWKFACGDRGPDRAGSGAASAAPAGQRPARRIHFRQISRGIAGRPEQVPPDIRSR